MRALPWLGSAVALAAGFLAGATSASVADAPARPLLAATRPAPRPRPEQRTPTPPRASPPPTEAPAPPDRIDGAPIVGTIVDDAGVAVSGVVVRARPEFEPPDEDEEKELSAEDAAERRLDWLRRVRGGTLTATTGEDGAFRIERVGGGLTYALDVRTDGFVLDDGESSKSEEVRAGDSVALVVERRCALAVEVEGASGERPAVRLAGPLDDGERPAACDFEAWTWSADRPTLWVPPGRWAVRAVAGERVSEVVTTTVAVDRPGEARLRLVACGRIECDLTRPPDLAAGQVTVTATRVADAFPQSVVGELQSDGRVTFSLLPPDRWTVSVVYPSQRVVATGEADVAPGACARLAFAPPPPDARDFVVVRVLDDDGLPVSSANVHSVDHRDFTPFDGPSAAEIAPGVYRAYHGGLPEEDHSMSVEAGLGHESDSASYVHGQEEEVVLHLPNLSPLDVRVGAGRTLEADCVGDSSKTRADEDGIARVGRRRHGDALLVRDDDPDSAMLVRLPYTGIVEWSPRPLRAWRVSWLGAGPAGDAGLRVGDLIVGVDDVEFRDAPHREVVWAAALARGRCRVDLMRDGRGAWIEMDLSLFRHDRAEAQLVPWVR